VVLKPVPPNTTVAGVPVALIGILGYIALLAFVTFYRDGVKALETTPLPVEDGLDAKSKAVPLRFSLH